MDVNEVLPRFSRGGFFSWGQSRLLPFWVQHAGQKTFSPQP